MAHTLLHVLLRWRAAAVWGLPSCHLFCYLTGLLLLLWTSSSVSQREVGLTLSPGDSRWTQAAPSLHPRPATGSLPQWLCACGNGLSQACFACETNDISNSGRAFPWFSGPPVTCAPMVPSAEVIPALRPPCHGCQRPAMARLLITPRSTLPSQHPSTSA